MQEWHLNPNQTINYVTAHDNNTLYDKLRLTGMSISKSELLQVQSNAIILASQGVSFLHAGVEMMRSKPLPGGGYDHNSYESPDSVNQLRWDRKAQYNDVFEYYKALIQIRNTYDHFRINNADEIRSRVEFLTTSSPLQTIAYKISGLEHEPEIIVMHSSHPSGGIAYVELPAGKQYKVLTYFEDFDLNGIEVVSDYLYVPSNTSAILVEVMGDPLDVKENLVTIDLGETFNPSSNLNIINPNATLYYSNYHNVDRAGRYTITVVSVDKYNVVKFYYYTLVVDGYKYNITIDESNIGG
jgi:pullulanase